MKIGLLVDLAGQRRWHSWLSADLARLKHEVVVMHPAGEAIRAYPAGLQLTLWFDRLWYRLDQEHAFDTIAPGQDMRTQATVRAPDEALDVLVDCSSGGDPRPKARRILRLTFNGEGSELGALAALLDEQPALVAIEDSLTPHTETARPAIARRECLTEALDSLFSSVVELLGERISRPRTGDAASIDAAAPSATGAAGRKLDRPARAMQAAAGHLAKLVSAKLARYLTLKTTAPRSWSMAVRRCAGTGLAAGAWPAQSSYGVVPDDGHRYYADPFLYEHNGRTYLFCEEFPFATGRGLISVAEIDGDGRVGQLRPALERPYHLSYPVVFEFDGQIWMMPESSTTGAVELYRAVEFPYRWALDRHLIDGLAGCDATIMALEGLYWMFLTSSRWRGSTWDKLRLYCASSPLGPWSEHGGGLVTVDCVLARPAGAALQRNGSWLRPAQNCSRIYGGGMTLVQIDELSTKAYRHHPVAEITATSPQGLAGTHTYSKSAEFEAIDVWGTLADAETVSLTCKPLGASEILCATARQIKDSRR